MVVKIIPRCQVPTTQAVQKTVEVPQVQFFDCRYFCCDAATSVIETERLEDEAQVPSFKEIQHLKATVFVSQCREE